MNLITVILIVILLWFLRSLLQSYKSLETQIRLVGLKCSNAQAPSQSPNPGSKQNPVKTQAHKGPLHAMTSGIIGALTNLSARI